MSVNYKWPTSPPDKLNMDEAVLMNLEKALMKVKIKSAMILKEGHLVFEFHKNRKVKNNLQKVNSCTKSIVSALIGIAIDKGFIPGVSQPVEAYFPEFIGKQTDIRKKQLTIEHLLTMTAGMNWPEFGKWNFFAPMVFSNDIVKFVIDRELVDDPGEKMNYNSGCSHILTAILQKASGLKASAFADKYLFGPLGMKYEWVEDNKGINHGADGLRLMPHDMCKFGQLYLQNGVWDSKQIISEEWVQRSTEPHYITYDNIGHYAYHWWVRKLESDLDDYSIHNRVLFAMGYGGQFICLIPKWRMVIVFTSELYDSTFKPMELVFEYVVKSVKTE